MQFEGLRRSSTTPNLTPLIDIVFLLLVFFMLTAHFVRDESIEVELPQAQTGNTLEEDKVTEIVIDEHGQVYLKDRQIPIEQLEMQLRNELAAREKKWVTLRGDRSTDLETMVTLLDTAHKAGAEAVDIVTNQP